MFYLKYIKQHNITFRNKFYFLAIDYQVTNNNYLKSNLPPKRFRKPSLSFFFSKCFKKFFNVYSLLITFIVSQNLKTAQKCFFFGNIKEHVG